MTKAEIHERFRHIVERATARSLDEFEALPVNSTAPMRYAVSVDTYNE